MLSFSRVSREKLLCVFLIAIVAAIHEPVHPIFRAIRSMANLILLIFE
jgi:hypothetical protein